MGTTIKFTTVYNKELEVKVPARTKPGSLLKIAGSGVPINGSKGDQYLLINPVIPDKIDDRIIQTILKSQQST